MGLLLAHQKQFIVTVSVLLQEGPEISISIFLYFSQVECNTVQEWSLLKL